MVYDVQKDYGSSDDDPSYYCSRHYDVFSTEDMIHWTGGRSFSSSEVPYNDEMLYAPDCIEKDGKYYLFYSQSGSGSVEGTAVSDSPYGPFRDGRPLEGAGQIDPSVFIDDDGQAWLFWGQFSAKCARLNPDMRSIDPSTIKDGIITEKEHHFHEGIQAFKHNGTYYLVFADISRRGMPTCLGYATSDKVTGPYKYRGVIIDNYGCDPSVWNNHGSVVRFKDRWYVFYHRSTCGTVTMRDREIDFALDPVGIGSQQFKIRKETSGNGVLNSHDRSLRTSVSKSLEQTLESRTLDYRNLLPPLGVEGSRSLLVETSTISLDCYFRHMNWGRLEP